MRIAVSGTHRVGKTTLAGALATALPGHVLVPEPYHLLEDDGHEFEDPPSLDDFEQQLTRSLLALETDARDVVFDRCPLDLVAYLQTHRDRDAFDAAAWLPRIRETMTSLDVLVFVPVEAPDRMSVDRNERRFRACVDDALRDLVLDDALDLGLDAIEVRGSVEARLRQVVALVGRAAPRRR